MCLGIFIDKCGFASRMRAHYDASPVVKNGHRHYRQGWLLLSAFNAVLHTIIIDIKILLVDNFVM